MKPQSSIWPLHRGATIFFFLLFLAMTALPLYWKIHGSVSINQGLQRDLLSAALFLLPLAVFLMAAGVWRRSGTMPIAFLLVTTVLLAIPYAATVPLGSSDVYANGYYGRLVEHFHQNPYTVPASYTLDDPYYARILADHPFRTTYGPLWVTMTAVVTRSVGENIPLAILCFRLLGLFSFLGILLLVWKIATVEQRFWIPLLAWNPFVLFESINNAHNDTFFVFLCMFGVWASMQQNKRARYALPLLMLAALVKYVSVALLPLVAMILWRRGQRREVWLGALLSAVLAVLAFFPYWEGFRIFSPLFVLGAAVVLPWYSPLRVGIFILQTLRFSLERAINLVQTVGSVLFLLWYGYLFYRSAVRKSTAIPLLALGVFGAMLAGVLMYFQPWYFLWVLPLLLFLPMPWRRSLLLLTTTVGLMTYLFY